MNFKSFNPPTIDTAAYCWRAATLYDLQRVIAEIRWGDWQRAQFFLGRASSLANVLMDVRHPQASHILRRVALVTRILKKAAGY